MGAFDRFRNLEKRRPERAEPDRAAESVVERFSQPEIPPDAAEAAPIRCLDCGVENPARSAKCGNCGANLDTAEVRASQVAERANFAASQKHLAALREARKKQGEAAAERALAELRLSQQQRRELFADGRSPLFLLLGWTRFVSDPQLRLALQIALVAGLAGLALWGLTSVSRLWSLVVACLLLFGGGYGRWGRRTRWW
jgi:hypothetical protein